MILVRRVLRQLIAGLIVLLAVMTSSALVQVVRADAAPTASCAAKVRDLNARIAAHNAKPHRFRLPQQSAQYQAYNAEAAALRRENAALRAQCRALPRGPERPALPPPGAPKKITGLTEHGQQNRLNRNGHGVNDGALNDAVRHPLKVTRQNGKYGTVFRYDGKNATVVLNSRGQVVTCWPRNRDGWRH